MTPAGASCPPAPAAARPRPAGPDPGGPRGRRGRAGGGGGGGGGGHGRVLLRGGAGPVRVHPAAVRGDQDREHQLQAEIRRASALIMTLSRTK